MMLMMSQRTNLEELLDAWHLVSSKTECYQEGDRHEPSDDHDEIKQRIHACMRVCVCWGLGFDNASKKISHVCVYGIEERSHRPSRTDALSLCHDISIAT